MKNVRGGGEIVNIRPSTANATPTQNLAEVEDLLAKTSFALEFPPKLENSFQAEIVDARAKNFVKLGLIGTLCYDSFLFTDQLMMPDIMNLILIVQLAIVTPVVLAVMYGIHRHVVKPETGVTFCELMILESILLFYTQSESAYAALLIFTVPAAMAFANVVLPLPFRLSVGFTLTCLSSSALAVALRHDADMTIASFIILDLATIGMFLIFSTYRAERSERKTYLFNLRERFRADVLAEKNEQLRSLSETDGLTGVYNRRYFDEALDRLWQAGVQAGEPLALCVVDIDHFKKLNDTFGHQQGDRCLKAVARCLQAHLMPNAVLARYGGEEFVVLLPGINALYARSCADVLRSAVSRLALASDDGSPVAMTVSIGAAAVVPTATLQSSGLMNAADQALYRAKANGRNRVEVAASPVRDAADMSIALPAPSSGCSISAMVAVASA